MIARKLALRNVVRRPAEALLVVVGAMLGTAIITGSLVFGDSLDASLRAKAPEQLGPVDAVARAADPAALDATADILDERAASAVAGTVDLVRTQAAVATPDERRAHPQAQILELDLAAAADLGPDEEATGLGGRSTPEGRTALVGADLAAALEVRPGDEVVLHAYGTEQALTVEAVLPRRGIAGFWLGYEHSSPNLFVAPGTLAELHAAAAPETAVVAPPPERLLLIATAGRDDPAEPPDLAALTSLEAALADAPVEIDVVKQTVLDDAERTADNLGELFLAVGSFAVLAGVLLLVNLFVMLAEERKRELGMLRAVGLRRRTLVAAFAYEGLGYATAAAALGALAGLGVGWAIVRAAAPLLSTFDVALAFAADPVSVVVGGLAGLVIAMVTVLGASLRIARLNIIRAVRDLPEPAERPRRRLVAVAAAVAAAALGAGAVAAVAAGEPVAALVLPALAAAALAVAVGRLLPRRLVASILGLGVLSWGLAADRVVDFRNADIFAFVAQGVVLVGAAVVLVAHNQQAIGAAVARLLGRRPLTRLGLAYPLARRVRTALTLGMYSLVVFTLVFIAVLAQVWDDGIDGLVRDEAGGFDVVADASAANPVTVDELLADDAVAGAAQLHMSPARAVTPSRTDPAPTLVGGFDDAFVTAGPPVLAEWDTDRYATERDVWEAVLAEGDLLIAGAFFLMQEGGPQARAVQVGDTVALVDPVSGTTREHTIAAVAKGGIAHPAAFVSAESAAATFAAAAPVRTYLRTTPDAAAESVAARLQTEHLASGLQARTFAAVVGEAVAMETQFLQLLQGYLALGLLIGIAGVGVVMVRAVRERRREIGMLRSLGLQARTVRGTFLLEAGYVTAAGVLLGGSLALVTAYRVVVDAAAFGEFDAGFTIPWPAVVALAGGALLASLVATVLPARRAARIHPALALQAAD